MSQKIINGDSAEVLKTIESNTIDAVVTDPPYGIEFLAKEWDRNTGAVEIWQECFRVLKPGGYLLAFSAARTYHNLATNIEGVGFDIRDQIMWIYASGFPKAQDIGKAIQRRQGVKQTQEKKLNQYGGIANQTEREGGLNYKENKQRETVIQEIIPTSPEAQQWSGWKTALKPAHEPICMARKPFKGSTIDNVLEHGVGALNIDATRIPAEQDLVDWYAKYPEQKSKDGVYENYNPEVTVRRANTQPVDTTEIQGRYPSNVLGDIPDYQKYFYCPKVSRKERHRGFEQDPISHLEMVEQMGGHYVDAEGNQDQSRSGGGNMIWLPHLGKIYTHGLKHEYEQWCRNNNKDPLGHIEKLSNYSQGDVKNHPLWDPSIGTNIQRLKHKILEHEKTLGQEHRVEGAVGNNHPTVKPVALMKYLVKLVTAEGAHIVDPFTGSGSTGMACRELNRQFTGIDLDKNYCEIATRRIDASQEDKRETLFE